MHTGTPLHTPATHRRPARRLAQAASGLLCTVLAGCMSPAAPYLEKGKTLSEAGFIAHQANTTARYAMMNLLPPGELTYRPSPSGPIYLYADPIGCGCVYMGSETAFRTLRNMTATQMQGKKQQPTPVVDELAAMTAENRRDTFVWDWSAWYAGADPGGDQPRKVIGGYW
ncbi:MAG: hypothetical protein ABF420_07625 [Acetobacter syzygii]|uniref:hypothetical protein n=1 Tax=Acetobacter syzygii TaxID=146476 RepID=UPI0039EB5258